MFDLHIHSLYSNDGEYSPTDLVRQCVKSGINVMAITDHNTVAATGEAKKSALEHNIDYIPGIEIDCTFKNTNFHVLGLGINFNDAVYKEIENNIRTQGQTISYARLQKIRELGFNIKEDDLHALSKHSFWPETWTGEMFAEIVLNHPDYKDHPLLKPFRSGGERSDNPLANFYWDFFAQGRSCFVKASYPDMTNIIDIIHQTHGYAVLAHPCVNLKGKMQLLTDIIKAGIDGIEAFSSYHTKEQAAYIFDIVKQNHLFTTCGSDYHGKIKPAIRLGQHHCTLTAEEMEKQLISLL